jgi:hypothetical protein
VTNLGTTELTEGVKHDSGKTTRPELIPPEAVEALGTVLAFGARKYADRNWELGMGWGRVFGAAMRHLWAWWRREDKDPETGYSHLWHAFTCVAFLLTYEQRKIGKDDRP